MHNSSFFSGKACPRLTVTDSNAPLFSVKHCYVPILSNSRLRTLNYRRPFFGSKLVGGWACPHTMLNQWRSYGDGARAIENMCPPYTLHMKFRKTLIKYFFLAYRVALAKAAIFREGTGACSPGKKRKMMYFGAF